MSKAFFVDGVGVSGAGMIDHLFNNDIKYLLIDEIDKMKKNDQAALLNVMETGILSETKLKGKTRQKRWNCGYLRPATILASYLRRWDHDLSNCI